ncbi:guanylate kinase [Paenibacillus ginsengarvi]|uniref:Guanylate kinase n=1 Tax=Paenibacillus ginsengarvi TaxID=400777 RepID=A0A3B0AM41_9BACL|nr:guanylate kinase [Paenibacillus ginsengarvi]RKN61391.1 guanylate kinase [Paenibacillus ginsengarvi]
MSQAKERRHLFVFTGPDGSGRKTIADMVGTTLELKKVLSYTTREARQGEQEDQDYHFISADAFRTEERNGAFVETVFIGGFYYGVKKADIERLWAEHRFVYVILNPEGAHLLKQAFGDAVIRLFLYADREALRHRQLERGDGVALVEERLAHYEAAMSYLPQCEYAFENVDLSHTVFSITNVIEQYLNRQLLNLD